MEVWCVYAANISLGRSVLNRTATLFCSALLSVSGAAAHALTRSQQTCLALALQCEK